MILLRACLRSHGLHVAPLALSPQDTLTARYACGIQRQLNAKQHFMAIETASQHWLYLPMQNCLHLEPEIQILWYGTQLARVVCIG